jgi:hypothetical protein
VDIAWSPHGIDGRNFDWAGLAKAADVLFVMAYDTQSQVRGRAGGWVGGGWGGVCVCVCVCVFFWGGGSWQSVGHPSLASSCCYGMAALRVLVGCANLVLRCAATRHWLPCAPLAGPVKLPGCTYAHKPQNRQLRQLWGTVWFLRPALGAAPCTAPAW